MNIRNAAVAAVLTLFSFSLQTAAAFNADDDVQRFRNALSLYERGMYSRAKSIFDRIPDVQAKGYSVLCSVNMREAGYVADMNGFLSEYPYAGFEPMLFWQHSLNLFDDGDYGEALRWIERIGEKDIDKSDKAEFLYKKAYCYFEQGDEKSALPIFERVAGMPYNDYTSPSRYGAGYINYEDKQFREALSWFEESVKDPRFQDVSSYYIMECHFMMKDYSYVIENGDNLFDVIPEERRPRLARIISESYLVRGDTANARKYYDEIGDARAKNRSDYFYAGTLMFTTGDYSSAIDNYEKMSERTDSIGQIANYNLGYSYIQTKNKVAALGSFKAASEASYDSVITEDAFYNYAKLAFDLNKDNTAFNSYIKKYSDKVKGDAIYGYMALSALYDHDYAAAVEAYNKIDELDRDMRSNYMKANYLRAEQLISGSSWRNAVPCLKAAAYYSDRSSALNRLSRYWLAESYYRNGQYGPAREMFSELYNASALYGREEGSLLPYNIAYCYYKENKYPQAIRWFEDYSKQSGASLRNDALVRKADCLFAEKDYKAAAEAYLYASDEIGNPDAVYPYYQAGIAYGLADDVKKKISSLERISGANPGSEYFDDASYELGRAYLNSGQDAKAAEEFNKIVSGSSSKDFIAKSLLDLGTIDRNARKYDSALAYYKRVVAEMPGTEYSGDALSAINLIYQAKGEPEAYLAYVEGIDSPVLKKDMDMEELVFGAAEQSALSGSWEKALALLRNYTERYPDGKYGDRVNFYMAESYRGLGSKEQAVDYYSKVLNGHEDTFKETSALNAAVLSYETEQFPQALEYYRRLSSIARTEDNKREAARGMMESAYNAKLYGDAIRYADAFSSEGGISSADKQEAVYIKAKSLLATSDRTAAMNLFKSLAADPKSARGAEASYILIQNSYDEGKFAEAEKMVYAFSDSGTGQSYWLAKAFITLGDSFVERDDYRQARATFESVRDGYKSSGASDDVLDNVNMRLKKLEEMEK